MPLPNRRLTIVLMMSLAGCLIAADSNDAKPAARGSWQGFTPGTFIVEKQTYLGLKYRPDGTEYRKTVLAKVDESGAAKFQDYTSDTPTGPWKISTAHSEPSGPKPSEKVESKAMPDEDVSIDSRTFRCAVAQTARTDDWGQETTLEWKDRASGLVLREQRQYAGQDPKGKSIQLTSSLSTTGIGERVVGQETFECFVQERHQSSNTGEQWWCTWATSNVPGRRVAMQSGKNKSGPSEIEIELVEWGRDLSLLVAMKENSPHFFEDRRQAEEKERKAQSDELVEKMIADLASGEAPRMLSGMSAVGQRSTIPPAARTAAIDALTKAKPLDHPAVEVRRGAGIALGQLGVRGLSARLGEMLRNDPEGANQYLEALGLQADEAALSAILPSLRSSDKDRRAAVIALRFFKDPVARRAVEKTLLDPVSFVRLAAVDSLEKNGDPDCVPALLRVLDDEDPTVVRAAIRVIGTLGDDSAVAPLLALLKKPNNDVRASVCVYISKLRLKETRPVGDALLPLLDDPTPQVRSYAVLSLGSLRERRAVPRLLQILQEPVDLKSSDSVLSPPMVALAALGMIGDPAAIPPLVKLLDVPGWGERAAEALLKMNDSGVAKELFAHYVRTAGDEKFRQVHRKELNALGKLGTAETRADLEAYLRRCPPPQKSAIREAISAMDQRLTR